jgi:TetR/AcrR family transcriptional regulator, mexJK operon transcriptional repressor
MPRKATSVARRGGRPSRAEAPLLRERILEAATDLFLAEGYGSTSIEAVAARAGISKRTFYDRFDDKAMLFAAVVHRIIERLRPPAGVPLIAGAALPEVLVRLAGLILAAALSAPAIALHRLISGESVRFPELARAVMSEGTTREAIAMIGDLLARELPEANLGSAERRFAAEQFMVMVISIPQRRAMGFGPRMTQADLDAWARHTVHLFLNGCRGEGVQANCAG